MAKEKDADSTEIMRGYGSAKSEELVRLQPIQKVGVYLAAFVGLVIAIVIGCVLFDYVRNIPTLPDLQNSQSEGSDQLVLSRHKEAQGLVLERVTEMFDLIVVKALLPVFTSILGYIFGTRAFGAAKAE